MNQIKESFTNFISKTKSKFFTTINKSKIFEQEFKWNLINFIITCATLVAAITTIVTTTSSSDKSIALGLVYGFYLPFALANCIISMIVAICYIRKEPKAFWKQWYYYMPLTIIFIEAIILPIPLNLVTRVTVNGGMMWSIIIFAFLAVFAAFASFIWIYKATLTDQSYILDSESDNDNPNELEKDEVKINEDVNKSLVVEPTKEEQEVTQLPAETATTLPYIGEVQNNDSNFTNQYDNVNNLETDVSHEDKKDDTTSINDNDEDKLSNYNNNTF